MLKSISKEYLLLAMDEDGNLPLVSYKINLIIASFSELYLKEFIY